MRRTSVRQDLVIVSGTLDAKRSKEFVESWGSAYPVVMMEGSFGVVDTFHAGCLVAWREFRPGIIACLHDDVRIDDRRWADVVVSFLEKYPQIGLVGFGGARGLGESWIYERPFEPMSLVRKDFISNMDGAEQHGRRVDIPTRVACLDGFSLIGRAELMLAGWHLFHGLGIVHHAYDSAFGALAQRWGLETWMLPFRCHHAGGMTAVGDPRYAEWAKEKHGGDKEVWWNAHLQVWREFKDVLPFWAPQEPQEAPEAHEPQEDPAEGDVQ